MFITLKERYKNGFCTAEQLERYVALGKLTREEYEKIVSGDESDN